MELYKLIATINNGTTTTFTMSWIPENFEGVKISQGFSFVNPIGYTPKFSVDTMRVILTDKTAIDTVFDTYGLESDIEIEIQKLKTSGTGYEYLSTFAIDFESYVKYDEFSEFALKSISTFDYYNNIKNTEQQIALTENATLPNTQKYINYVSLAKNNFSLTDSKITFSKNNESKIYNSDTSLFPSDTIIYSFATPNSNEIKISINASFFIYLDGLADIIDVVFGVTNGGTYTDIAQITEFEMGNYQADNFYINMIFSINRAFFSGDNLCIKITSRFSTPIEVIVDKFYIDFYVTTNKLIISSNETIKYISVTDILNNIFNNNISIPTDAVYDFGITSANQISKLNNFANIKPKEFLADFCLMVGAVLNFELAGSVVIKQLSDYFNTLLNTANAIEITNFKDLSINYNTSLNFASVSVGQEISDYDVSTYLSDWNKILTFKQENRNASENLDLSLSKYRGDFSGMLDYFYKRSQQKTATSKDNFIFNPNFSYKTGSVRGNSLIFYDLFTPRDILVNWSKYLSFCFQNFGKNTLTISSNGGTTDNLQISGVNQMDDLVLTETPRLLPIQYNLTGLIGNVDFSQKIIKINHEGTDIYLFIFEAETTDQLNEQTIKGLKIQF